MPEAQEVGVFAACKTSTRASDTAGTVYQIGNMQTLDSSLLSVAMHFLLTNNVENFRTFRRFSPKSRSLEVRKSPK